MEPAPFAAFVIATLFLASIGHTVETPVTVDRIDAMVLAAMKEQQIPGAAVAVVHKGEVIVAKGYGESNVEHHVPVTADTVFQTASVGKQFTAVVMMLLVEDGRLSLDGYSIAKFFPNAPKSWSVITVRHLLTHTGGVPEYTTDKFDFRKDYTEDQLAEFAFKQEPEFAPGEQWRYSNTGYALLGFIARKAGGRFYGDVLRDRVFKPLGMKTARVINEEDIVPNRAAGYRLVNGQLKNQEWVAPTLNTTADGALYVSIHDMVVWERGLRSKAILKPQSWEMIFTPVTLKSGKTHPYGFGWAIDEDCGQLRHSHSGAWQGFKTHIVRYLGDDLSIIVLTNLAEASPSSISEKIAALFNPKLAPSSSPVGK